MTRICSRLRQRCADLRNKKPTKNITICKKRNNPNSSSSSPKKSKAAATAAKSRRSRGGGNSVRSSYGYDVDDDGHGQQYFDPDAIEKIADGLEQMVRSWNKCDQSIDDVDERRRSPLADINDVLRQLCVVDPPQATLASSSARARQPAQIFVEDIVEFVRPSVLPPAATLELLRNEDELAGILPESTVVDSEILQQDGKIDDVMDRLNSNDINVAPDKPECGVDQPTECRIGDDDVQQQQQRRDEQHSSDDSNLSDTNVSIVSCRTTFTEQLYAAGAAGNAPDDSTRTESKNNEVNDGIGEASENNVNNSAAAAAVGAALIIVEDTSTADVDSCSDGTARKTSTSAIDVVARLQSADASYNDVDISRNFSYPSPAAAAAAVIPSKVIDHNSSYRCNNRNNCHYSSANNNSYSYVRDNNHIDVADPHIRPVIFEFPVLQQQQQHRGIIDGEECMKQLHLLQKSVTLTTEKARYININGSADAPPASHGVRKINGTGSRGLIQKKSSLSDPPLPSPAHRRNRPSNLLPEKTKIDHENVAETTDNVDIYKKKVEELQIALLECAMEYEVKIVEMKMEMLQMKSEKRLQINVSGSQGSADCPTPSTPPDMEGRSGGRAAAAAQRRPVEYLRKQLCKMQREKRALSRELSILKKRERQFDLQRRGLNDALGRVSTLQRELGKREQEIMECQAREKEARAELEEVQAALRQAQAAQLDPRRLLALLPALRDWIQTVKKAPSPHASNHGRDPWSGGHLFMDERSAAAGSIVCNVTREIQALQKALSKLAACRR